VEILDLSLGGATRGYLVTGTGTVLVRYTSGFEEVDLGTTGAAQVAAVDSERAWVVGSIGGNALAWRLVGFDPEPAVLPGIGRTYELSEVEVVVLPD
jgi:hypothetical protein